MPESDLQVNEWSPAKKQVFRFFFIFLLFYILVNPNDVIPYFNIIQRLFRQPCYHLVVWLADFFLKIEIPPKDLYHTATDTTLNYLVVLFSVCLSCLGSMIWLLADKNRTNYSKLKAALILILRYYLAITWIAYGSLKFIHLQFPALTPITLFHTYGDSLPRELAWNFMGYSTGFNYFLGITEFMVAAALLFRRTSTFGNLIGIGALANILAFNYFFDDNVKLLGTMLMVMSLFLLSADARALTEFFFFGKTAALGATRRMQDKTGFSNSAPIIFKCVAVICLIAFDLHSFSIKKEQFGYGVSKPPLYGVYTVKTFIIGSDTPGRLSADTTRWSKLIVSSIPGKAAVELINNKLRYFVIRADTLNDRVQLIADKDAPDSYIMNYALTSDGLYLYGKHDNDSIKVRLQRLALDSLPLLKHKFHWIINRQNRLRR